MKRNVRVYASAAVLLSAVACADTNDPMVAPQEPSFALVSVSGKVLLPNGNGVCGQYESGTIYSVRLIKVVEDGPDVAVGVSPMITCPSNSWTFPTELEEGAKYIARMTTE